MHAEFKTIDPATLSENLFDLIGKEWMLITAGSRDAFNTMTASWGGMGVLSGQERLFLLRSSRPPHLQIHGSRRFFYPFFFR